MSADSAPSSPDVLPMALRWTPDEIRLAARVIECAVADKELDQTEWLRPEFLTETIAPMLRQFVEVSERLPALVKDAVRMDWLDRAGQVSIREGTDGHEWAVCREDWTQGFGKHIELGEGIDVREAIDRAIDSLAKRAAHWTTECDECGARDVRPASTQCPNSQCNGTMRARSASEVPHV